MTKFEEVTNWNLINQVDRIAESVDFVKDSFITFFI